MWHKRTIKLNKNISVKAKPGNNIFVANRGEVSFEYPGSWIVKPSDNSICFYDAQPPTDQCVLEFSVMHLDLSVDWANLSLDRMLCSAIRDEAGPRDLASVHRFTRGRPESCLARIRISSIWSNTARPSRGVPWPCARRFFH